MNIAPHPTVYRTLVMGGRVLSAVIIVAMTIRVLELFMGFR